jgi:ubiquitin-protein ligase
LIDEKIEQFNFEVILPSGYPFMEPQVFCHTKFAHDLLTLTDGRDLFREIVGEDPW